MLAKPALVILAVCCAMLIGHWIIDTGSADASSTPSNTQVTVSMDASWTRLYHDLRSLRLASDVVVEGSVTAVIGQSIDQEIPFTDFIFQVAHTLSDPNHLLTGGPIVIHQSGGPVTMNIKGTMTTVHMEITDDPLMHVGDHLFLFLHQYAPGHYFVVGGPSGRFAVLNGIVRPINDEGVRVSGSPSSAAFTSTVQAA
ncbi:MAG TPA: hypothetical protein VJQ45_11085 [Ktedonobacterales bacterium]|nr:hypothetical protein [Ktedonobacterales bacterium]